MATKRKQSIAKPRVYPAAGKNGSGKQPARQEAEALYRDLFNRMADAVFVIDAETLRFVDCNEAACQTYGYTRQQFLSMTPLPLHPPDERDLALARLKEKKWARREYTHVTKDGRQLTVEIRTANVTYHGRPAHVSIVHDVTRRALAQQKSDLHVQQTPLGVIEWNPDFEVQEWNPAAERIFGYSRAEAVGKHASFIVPELARGQVEAVWKGLMANKGGSRSTNENRARDGRIIACEWYNTPLVDRAGNVIGAASLVHDITERKLAEEALQVQKAYLEQLIESAPEAIAILDNDHNVVRVNREFSTMFGYSPQEIGGQSLERLVPIERVNESNFIWSALARGQSINVETVRQRRDGSQLEVSILGTPIKVSGSPVAVYLIYRDITQSKRAERALVESESKFRAVAETAASAIYIHDNKRFLYVNRACEQISGYTRPELMEMGPWLLIDPEFREQMRQRSEARLRGETVPSRYEFKIVTKSGDVRWLDFSANCIRFEGRAATLATAVDVTERKRGEQLQRALYRIADQTSWASDLPAFYSAIHNIVGELMYARNFYIASYDDDTGLLSFPYFVDEEDPTPAPKRLGKGLTEYVLRTGEPLLASPERFSTLVQSGEVETIGAPSIDWLGIPMKNGDKTFGVLVVQSYTPNIRYQERDKEILNFVGQHVATAIEHKRAENALRRSEARYRSLVHSAVYGMYRSSLDDHFIDVNPALLEMLGYDSEQELLGLSISRDVFVESEDRPRFIDQCRNAERVDGVEVRWKRKDGTPVTVRLSGRPLRTGNGELAGFEMIAENVTERHALEEQLRQSQKMEAIGRLAGGVAHDFNNLLTIIKGYTELMVSDLKPADPMRAELLEVQKAGDRAAALTRQLLAFSRRQVMAPKVLNLNHLVEDLNKMLRRLLGEDIELCLRLEERLGSVKADPGQMEQVLMNLAVNARDAMPKGGKLTIETGNLDLDQAYTREHVTVKPGAYVMFAVSDTGFGMAPETMSHIFEPFFTTKEQGKGTGLGLSTVYGIVKQSGGYIWPYSEVGIGTTFKIYLPRVDEVAERLLARPQLAPSLRGTETILLVEDEKGVRTLTRQVLERSGYTVLEAEHGDDATLLCERYSGTIHLLLSDVVLTRMSGREMVQRLGPMRPNMKILYMSGYTDEAIIQHGVLQPGTAFLQKPFTPESLLRKVREVLEAKSL